MPIGVYTFEEWGQRVVRNIYMQEAIHNPVKHAHLCRSPMTYPSQYVYLNRPVSQMRATLAACRELALDYNTYL